VARAYAQAVSSLRPPPSPTVSESERAIVERAVGLLAGTILNVGGGGKGGGRKSGGKDK